MAKRQPKKTTKTTKAKTAWRTAKKPAKAVPKPAARAKPGKRVSWLDAKSQKPVIDRYARQLGPFISAMADGRINADEVAAQETRVAKLMKAIEPKLDDAMHEKITQLLCELTAYDLMQVLHSMYAARPKVAFRG